MDVESNTHDFIKKLGSSIVVQNLDRNYLQNIFGIFPLIISTMSHENMKVLPELCSLKLKTQCL